MHTRTHTACALRQTLTSLGHSPFCTPGTNFQRPCSSSTAEPTTVESLFAQGARAVGTGLWKGGDQRAIDGVMVNGSARLVGWFSGVLRLVQSGLIYWYAFMMIFGVCAIYAVVKYRLIGG